MKGSEFLKRVRKAAKRKGWSFDWYPDMGKGSHGILIVNAHRTTVRNLKDELKTGTFYGMLKQLQISEEDL